MQAGPKKNKPNTKEAKTKTYSTDTKKGSPRKRVHKKNTNQEADNV